MHTSSYKVIQIVSTQSDKTITSSSSLDTLITLTLDFVLRELLGMSFPWSLRGVRDGEDTDNVDMARTSLNADGDERSESEPELRSEFTGNAKVGNENLLV